MPVTHYSAALLARLVAFSGPTLLAVPKKPAKRDRQTKGFTSNIFGNWVVPELHVCTHEMARGSSLHMPVDDPVLEAS
jgi:hypothetical protein